MVKRKTDLTNVKCCICERTNLNSKIALREYKGKNWTGNWLCRWCWYHIDYKYRPDSSNNIIKQLANHRTGNLNPNCSSAIGDRYQELTCRWRSLVSAIPVEDLNEKLDNYNSPIDHTIDTELGIIQTKGRIYISYPYGHWGLTGVEREWYKEFDRLIFYCISEDGKIIERIYIFPKKDIIGIKGVTIYKSPCKGVQWYEEYRVKDEEIIKKVNEIWKEIISGR